MPGHGSKKQSQRTKGNVRPSSSSQAAELLTSAGTAATGFIGFGSSPKYVPVSSALDDMDTSLDPDFRLVLRKLTKRDATTKIKGLQEFGDLCKEKSEEDLKAVLPFWPRIYNKVALDVDYRVREAAQHALSALVVRVRRNLAPYLRNLMGAWLLSQCDTYPTVASTALAAFQNTFPPVKQTEALVYCKDSIMEYLSENLVTHTPQTLSDPKSTEPEDMENKYNRVLTASLLAARKLMSSVTTNEMKSLENSLTTLLENPKFWKHGKSKINMVKGGMYSFLAGLCQTLPELGVVYSTKISPFVLHSLDETDPIICTHLWEACLSVVNYLQDCWSHVNVQKAFWPKLRKSLETGCHGNAVVIAPNLLPLLSRIPHDLFPDRDKFYEEYFTYFKLGLGAGSVEKSPSECSAMVRAFMECARYVVTQNVETNIAAHVLLDQVLPVVEASLVEKDSPLYRSPLYSMLGGLLSSVENVTSDSTRLCSVQFWTHLKESMEAKLTSNEELSKGDNFEERLLFLVRCLFNPETEVKQKMSKVKFEDSSELDSQTKIPKIEVKKELKMTIPEQARKFVHELIVSAFQVAHKQFSTSHLRIFAQLLELDPADDLIAKIIACCHGDVAMETTSHYFVFEICVPWIQKLHEDKCVRTDFTHLIHIVCIFLPVLEKDSVMQLLKTLYENCRDSHSQLVFLQMLFSKAQSVMAVQDWVQGGEFGECLVQQAQTVCDRDVDEMWQEDTTNVINILSLILAARTNNRDLLVGRQYIDRLLSVLQLPLQKLTTATYIPNRADLAISFVARAAQCFFTQYQECLMTESAKGLLETLFQVSLCNQCCVSDETLSEAREAWTIGVAFTIQQTGGLLTESSLLSRLVKAVHTSVASTGFSTIAKLQAAVESVEILLETLCNNLPLDSEEVNPVYTAYCHQLIVNASLCVPNQIWEYLCVQGDYPTIPQSHRDGEPVIQTLFTSLFNCKLLMYIYKQACEGSDVAMETSQCSDWRRESLESLLECIEASTIVSHVTEQNKVLADIGDMGEASARLGESVITMVTSLTGSSRDTLWQLAFTRIQKETDYVLCLKKVLSLMRSASSEPLVLELSPIIDRSGTLTADVVYMLLSTIDYLSPSNMTTLSEIMVARLLSLDIDSVTNTDGGLGMLCVISHVIPAMTEADEAMSEMFLGALDQVISWKEDKADLFLYSCDLSQAGRESILLNAQICRVLTSLVDKLSGSLSNKQWDFIMCSLVSWIQSIEESELEDFSGALLHCYLSSVLDLLSQVAICLREKVGSMPGNYPANLGTEWTEFFGESIFGVVLPLFLKVCKLTKDSAVKGTDRLLLQSVCNAASQTPKCHIMEHKLPPLLIAGDLSPLPDSLQSLLNHICPLLLASERSVQVAAFHLLHSVVDSLPQYDQEDKSFVAGAQGGEEKEENLTRSPPVQLMDVVRQSSAVLEVLLGDLQIESKQPMSFQKEEYHYAMAYLLSWKLLLHFFKSAPSQLRQEYAGFFQENGHVDQLMYNVFQMMPSSPGKMCQIKPLLDVRDTGSCTEIQHVACALYQQILTTMPAMARTWWKNQDRKTAAYVDMFTTKHVSHILCTSEIQSVQQTEVQLQDMTIKARPVTREVIAVYSLEEVSIEMVISLPQNYPLGNISVVSEKRVGVSGPQWEKWLLQLNIFLQHQNGNILDGLRLWKNNIDKRFEGVDECMICFYVLHGTNFQLPRIACRTCKKKFHSSCLYKWFNTSHNCTCPLCRNVF